MKITLNPKSDILTSPYPKLMQGETGVVVLFSSKGTGFVVSTPNTYKVGYYSAEWYSAGFKDYTGKVTLENS
jgi:hypothetical protein